ncbi:MAG: hypothetical protein KC729_18685, partial [Candidatus Eisenbacteria bacterium]|nr:hypothetical protein [Candidatus Eisenbacteria bacterium]
MRMDLPVDEEAALDAPSDEDLAACETFASTCHPDCIACRPRSLRGLGLVFRLAPDGSAIARFPCDPGFQGYPDRLHGGIIATLLDAAMTHRLFASKIRAYTARMDLR